jgi:hypothetical protein
MAALVSICTKEEQRAMVRFYSAEGVPGAHSFGAVWKQSFASSKCVKWITVFKSGDTNVTDEQRSGCRPQPLQTKTFNESTPWFCTVDG